MNCLVNFFKYNRKFIKALDREGHHLKGSKLISICVHISNECYIVQNFYSYMQYFSWLN